MKFLAMILVLIALAGLALSLFLGLSYHFEGHGLHPVIAGLFGALSASAGWLAAGKID